MGAALESGVRLASHPDIGRTTQLRAREFLRQHDALTKIL
jgi:hypothetical protein